jgi:hypothetical protein
MWGHHDASGRATGHDRLLPVLAVERAPRAIVLIGVGLILLTLHAGWPTWRDASPSRSGWTPVAASDDQANPWALWA